MLADDSTQETHTREPEWNDEQRQLVIEYLRWQRRIGPHGHPMDEATSPLADPANREAEWRYYADPLPIVDHAARARGLVEEAYRRNLREGDSMAGLIFTVEKVPVDPTRPRL